MKDAMHGRALLKRIVDERRRVLLPIGVALALNLVVYVLVVYPLSQRVANVEQRTTAADRSLIEARREHAQAAGTLTGKARAGTELATFYRDILPQDLAGARRLTHLRLAQMARQAGLHYGSVSAEEVALRNSTLTRLAVEMDLSGSYPDIRRFIHQLEVAPEFVVIENVELQEDADETSQLSVTVELSTYYRGTPVTAP